MLTRLQIQNYAIIDDVSITFSDGLSIITGETGAGKSIILGALGLIMGKRADTKVLYNPDSKCFVEARFQISNAEIATILADEELDNDDELIIRREISSTGKSRAFVNDTPVNLDVLQKLAIHLLDLHQQWDNLDIHEEDYQMEMLDSFAGNAETLKVYKTSYLEWKAENKYLASLQNTLQQASRENEFNRFLVDELDKTDLRKGEQEGLENELDLLSNAQSILETFSKITHDIEETEPSILSGLTGLLHSLSGLQDLSPVYKELYGRLYSSIEELKDIARESGRIVDKTEFNPLKIQELKDRLSVLYKLQKKHGVSTEEDLLRVYEDLQSGIQNIDNLETQISQSTLKIADMEGEMKKIALQLHVQRKKSTPLFEKEVHELLTLLKMDHAQLKIELPEQTNFTANGLDGIKWLFAANKGSAFLPLKSVASGGEISRLNLCIKSILASKMTLPTLIFDEIDTGVSGDVANKMGELLTRVSNGHQVISITHSPQVAAKALHHIFVFKDHRGDKTLTKIKLLTKDEKIREIAVMLSSDPPSPTAIEAARELLAG